MLTAVHLLWLNSGELHLVQSQGSGERTPYNHTQAPVRTPHRRRVFRFVLYTVLDRSLETGRGLLYQETARPGVIAQYFILEKDKGDEERRQWRWSRFDAAPTVCTAPLYDSLNSHHHMFGMDRRYT